MRTYTEDELRQIFEECSYAVDAVEPVTLGRNARRRDVERLLVVARPA